MKNVIRLLAFAAPVFLIAAAAAAQTPPADITAMTLEDLLAVEVVSTASKFPQEVTEAPASITVITAEEIRRSGHRTLSDTLRGVRGFYTTYDRNYSYVGMRGFARPGDYNTRILLLLDGHRLNDGIYDMAPIGTDFPVDISLIERIEIIRGPGSSLYGTSAFFAVINVVTRTGATRNGLRVEALGGSLGTGGVSASIGGLFGGDREVLVGGSTYRSSGQERLRYPEFDTDGDGAGVAVGLDDDRASNVFASASAGPFSIRAGVAHRRKQIPTASFGTVFGNSGESTVDDRAFVDGVYDGVLGRGWAGTARLAYDYYRYQGHYPFDYGEDGIAGSQDGATVQTLTGELTARRRFARVHLFTAGVEVRHQGQNNQWGRNIYGESLDVDAPGTDAGFYAQDEVRFFPWLLGNVGVRVDRFSAYGAHAAPRAGLVILPRRETAIKVLYGHAFRAPNAYELFYYPLTLDADRRLGPEQMRSSELVWEESLSRYVRTVVTAFRYDAERIIEQRILDGADESSIYFANGGGVRGVGVEGEIETRLSSGISARVSHTFARVSDPLTGSAVSNSPRHLSKLNLQFPVSRLFLAIEGQYVGRRLTLGGDALPGFFIPNIVLSSPADRRIGFTVGVYNAFDHSYADPGAEEHVQRAIPQDGRTMLARVRVAF